MKQSLRNKYINQIVLLQSFENLWNFYSISEGELFKKETKESAFKLCNYFEIVYEDDPGIYNSKTITYNKKDNEVFVRDILEHLKKWSTNEVPFPFSHVGMSDNETSRYALQGFLMCEKVYLCRQLDLEVFPNIISSSGEGAYHKNKIRWKAHLHWQAIDLIADGLVSNMSSSDSIVLVADIRKSQDLMIYGPNADFYRDKILEFTSKIRKIIMDKYGVFDKFTGDGFICYFNSYLCERFGKDYYEQLIKSCNEIMEFSESFFKEWTKYIRKLPPNSSGLAIGIDSGVVTFSDIENHLFAIGDSIVWANRMSSAGEKGEIILNNIPFNKIREKNENIDFEIINDKTKSGESFMAFKMVFK